MINHQPDCSSHGAEAGLRTASTMRHWRRPAVPVGLPARRGGRCAPSSAPARPGRAFIDGWAAAAMARGVGGGRGRRRGREDRGKNGWEGEEARKREAVRVGERVQGVGWKQQEEERDDSSVDIESSTMKIHEGVTGRR
eukprot:765826-Hanusia_phi.AAC.10